MTTLSFSEVRVGRISVPTIRIGAADVVELLLPPGWNEGDDEQLLSFLHREAGRFDVVLRKAGVLEPRQRSWFSRFRDPTILAELAEFTGLSDRDARDVCQRCGVPPEQLASVTPWTERKLLAFELASAGADIVVVDDLGFDPRGEERFVSHLRQSVKSGDVSALALRYPATFDTGRWTTHAVALTFTT